SLPEALNSSRIGTSSSSQATYIQPAEELVVTADETKSLDVSEYARRRKTRMKLLKPKRKHFYNIRGTSSSHSQTSLGESGEVKGYPRPIIVSALRFQNFLYRLSMHPEDDTKGLKIPDG
ncbi:hypothetical protein Tco_0135371, partial [Tanacetum coccineum]